MTQAPILKHSSWRHLLQAFVSDHPGMRPVPASVLRTTLTPAASMAWWLAREVPELLEHDSICILAPGAGNAESIDHGRWLGFIPWLLGRPRLQVETILVGNELIGDRDGNVASSTRLSPARLAEELTTPYSPRVRDRQESVIFNGTLGQWRKSTGAEATFDACILFSPGFTSHLHEWLLEDELLPVLRSGAPIGVFGYSLLDCLEDQQVLRLVGIDVKRPEVTLNPWHVEGELSEHLGAYAQCCWTIREPQWESVNLESEALKEFEALQQYGQADFLEQGGDATMELMGSRQSFQLRSTSRKDAVILLPHGMGVEESTREVVQVEEHRLGRFTPPLIIPLEQMESRPDDAHLLERIHWALRLHRDWVIPELNARAEHSEASETRRLAASLMRSGTGYL